MVGVANGSPMSAYGYKRPFDASRITSASPPAAEIRELELYKVCLPPTVEEAILHLRSKNDVLLEIPLRKVAVSLKR